MNIVPMMVGMSTLLGVGFTIAFLYFLGRGQFDDCETPAHRMLLDDETKLSQKGHGNE